MAIPAIEPYELPSELTLPACRAPWALEPGRAALLVHDMQAHFLRAFDPRASPMAPMLANVQALLAACARSGVPVFFSMQPGRQTRAERGLLWDVWGPGIVENPELEALAPDLGDPAPDARVVKHRYSAFFQTSLHDRMRALGRDQLLITGIYAHIGCLTTAVDGFMRGVKPFLVADAIADFTRHDHDTALRQVAQTCGVVASTGQALRAMGASAGAREARDRPSRRDSGPQPTLPRESSADVGRLGYKARAYALVPARADRILDLGCGSGDDVLAIAEEARADAYVVGIDTSLAAVEEAMRRARHTALNVRLAVGDARALPFSDASFDVVRADRLLQDVDDPLRVASEMARVARPGGTVLVHDREDVLAPHVVAVLERVGLVAVATVDAWPWEDARARGRGLSIRAQKPLSAEER